MADRNSADIFGLLFEKLASDPTKQHKTWAREFYEKSRTYDFSPDQMDCDEALVKLGLAKMSDDDLVYEGWE